MYIREFNESDVRAFVEQNPETYPKRVQ